MNKEDFTYFNWKHLDGKTLQFNVGAVDSETHKDKEWICVMGKDVNTGIIYCIHSVEQEKDRK